MDQLFKAVYPLHFLLWSKNIDLFHMQMMWSPVYPLYLNSTLCLRGHRGGIKATFSQNRKANGAMLKTRIRNKIGPWKSGKFIAITNCPHSLNYYALSKIWFICNSINLRGEDIKFINSQAKQWLYKDLLESPSELVLYRQIGDGSLGLINVKYRAMALLIRFF